MGLMAMRLQNIIIFTLLSALFSLFLVENTKAYLDGYLTWTTKLDFWKDYMIISNDTHIFLIKDWENCGYRYPPHCSIKEKVDEYIYIPEGIFPTSTIVVNDDFYFFSRNNHSFIKINLISRNKTLLTSLWGRSNFYICDRGRPPHVYTRFQATAYDPVAKGFYVQGYCGEQNYLEFFYLDVEMNQTYNLGASGSGNHIFDDQGNLWIAYGYACGFANRTGRLSWGTVYLAPYPWTCGQMILFVPFNPELVKYNITKDMVCAQNYVGMPYCFEGIFERGVNISFDYFYPADSYKLMPDGYIWWSSSVYRWIMKVIPMVWSPPLPTPPCGICDTSQMPDNFVWYPIKGICLFANLLTCQPMSIFLVLVFFSLLFGFAYFKLEGWFK
jgi:hypothetical protein